MALDKLNQAIQLIQAGNKQAALPILKEIVRSDANNEEAWLWLYTCVDQISQKRYCLNKALEINPNNRNASEALDRLQSISQEHLLQPKNPPTHGQADMKADVYPQKIQPAIVQKRKPRKKQTGCLTYILMFTLLLFLISAAAFIYFLKLFPFPFPQNIAADVNYMTPIFYNVTVDEDSNPSWNKGYVQVAYKNISDKMLVLSVSDLESKVSNAAKGAYVETKEGKNYDAYYLSVDSMRNGTDLFYKIPNQCVEELRLNSSHHKATINNSFPKIYVPPSYILVKYLQHVYSDADQKYYYLGNCFAGTWEFTFAKAAHPTRLVFPNAPEWNVELDTVPQTIDFTSVVDETKLSSFADIPRVLIDNPNGVYEKAEGIFYSGIYSDPYITTIDVDLPVSSENRNVLEKESASYNTPGMFIYSNKGFLTFCTETSKSEGFFDPGAKSLVDFSVPEGYNTTATYYSYSSLSSCTAEFVPSEIYDKYYLVMWWKNENYYHTYLIDLPLSSMEKHSWYRKHVP